MTRSRWSVAARAQMVAVALVTLAGCAIAVDSAPRPVANVPTDLFNTTTTSEVPDKAANRLFLYFVNASNNLVRVELPRDAPADPQDAIDALVAPSQDVLAAGLTTRVPELGFKASPGLGEGGVLTVTVEGSELRATSKTDATKVAQIYAQIVCTVTELNMGAVAVEIKDSEGQIPVVVAPTSPETHPVTRENFANCLTDPTPPQLVPTTTTRPTTTTSTIRRLNPSSVSDATTVPGSETTVPVEP